MKLLILALMTFGISASASATPWDPGICDERIKDHKDLLDLTIGRFGAGELNRTDVAIAELAYEEARFECGRITRSVFCRSALRSISTYLNGINEEARIGQRTTLDLVQARLRFYKIRNECN